MKKRALSILLACAIAGISATALAAYEDTEYFTIARLEASTGSEGGYRVYPLNYALPNGYACPKTDFAEIYPGLASTDREMMHHTLLAAFMAGRKVRLRLEDCGVTERPSYRIVTLHSGQ